MKIPCLKRRTGKCQNQKNGHVKGQSTSNPDKGKAPMRAVEQLVRLLMDEIVANLDKILANYDASKVMLY